MMGADIFMEYHPLTGTGTAAVYMPGQAREDQRKMTSELKKESERGAQKINHYP